jgi:hypothetical protein
MTNKYILNQLFKIKKNKIKQIKMIKVFNNWKKYKLKYKNNQARVNSDTLKSNLNKKELCYKLKINYIN